MQSLHGNCLIAYARHKYILTMVNGEYRYFNGGDLVFADASQIRVDKCVENFVLVSKGYAFIISADAQGGGIKSSCT